MPGSDEILIRVFACGICGTDVHIFEGDKGAADNPLPIVLGHELAGTVEKTGSGVTGYAQGDHVCVDPNVLCGHCGYCRGGIGHFCEHMTGIGTTVDGGFSQYCVVPQRAVYHLAPHIPFSAGAMSEPLSCCLHGIDMCGIKPGENVVVIGGGMIGLLMIQLTKISGAAFTALVEPVESKRAEGKRLGADLCMDPASEDILETLAKNGVRRVGVVIECVGKPATIEQAIGIAGKYSTVMMFGLTKPEEEVHILPYEIFRKEVVLKASYINPYTIGRAIDLISREKVDVSSMLTEVIPLERLPEVLSSSTLRSKGKFVVDPWK